MSKDYTIDASGKILGRLASEIAVLLVGKNMPDFVPYKDNIFNVTVINTDEIKVTGNKEVAKKYYHYSGFPGGIKATSYGKMFEKDSGKVLRLAVLGMLPKNKLRSRRIARLKLYKKAMLVGRQA
ncbi:MAG: 50S ribosomal protein L13 [Parcubacteria group bacterium GW2011_GWA2_38_13b]|nr:MAG: 50S ribosomal protein L13 [Parcubacteria group bacterium GW2011_GWA2_38_13b]